MKRIRRNRFLTPEEAAKNREIIAAVEDELPDLIARHHQRHGPSTKDQETMQTIEIREFPGWVCPDCNQTGSTRNSRPVYCPNCNGRDVYQYNGPQPEGWPVMQSIINSFDLCHPSDKQWVVVFHELDGYTSKRVSVFMNRDDEFDINGMSALEVATRLHEIPGGWSSKRNDLPPLIEWLKEFHISHELKRLEYLAERAQWRLWQQYEAACDARRDLVQFEIELEEEGGLPADA